MRKKYRMLKGQVIKDPFIPSRELKIYRIQALRDIPEHNVRRGELGGFVTDKMTLSHAGTCWIGGNALVHGAVVSGDALVAGSAIVYGGTETAVEMFNRRSKVFAADKRLANTAFARITVEEDAVIGQNAVVTAFEAPTNYINPVKIKGYAFIGGSARAKSPALVCDNASVYGNSEIGFHTRIGGKARIYGSAKVAQEATVGGTVEILGDVSVGRNSMLFGNLRLAGSVKIAEYTKIDNNDNIVLINGETIGPGHKLLKSEKTTGYPEQDAINRILDRAVGSVRTTTPAAAPQKTLGSGKQPTHPGVNSAKIAKYNGLLQEILDSLNSYETDIVKIIKYPVMVDKTDGYTASMLSAKRAVSLIDPETEETEFYAAVLEFDKAFHAAEANALKLSNSLLEPEEQKKARKAQDLFSIAVDSASTENEKEQAFRQGLKQLEGVILVPDRAVAALRAKAGLAELSV